jgi:hypothetical protein
VVGATTTVAVSLNVINQIFVINHVLMTEPDWTRLMKLIAPVFAFANLLFSFILHDLSISKKILCCHVPPSQFSKQNAHTFDGYLQSLVHNHHSTPLFGPKSHSSAHIPSLFGPLLSLYPSPQYSILHVGEHQSPGFKFPSSHASSSIVQIILSGQFISTNPSPHVCKVHDGLHPFNARGLHSNKPIFPGQQIDGSLVQSVPLLQYLHSSHVSSS